MSHPRRNAALFVLGLVLLVGYAAPALAECSPRFDARLDTEEPQNGMTNLQFHVQVFTPGDCVRVVYDLIIEIRAPNGHSQLVRKMRSFQLTGEEATDIVRHRVVTGSRIVSQKAQVVECIPCDSP